MIQVFKRTNPPPELATKGYRDETVVKALNEDQYGKCYICERETGTEFDVEHLKCDNALRNDWSNLFLACRYCNDKKLNNYDDILNPQTSPIENLIEQSYDAATRHFTFTAKEATDAAAKTIQLLNLVFNGYRPKMRTLRETKFLREFEEEFTAFIESVNEYLDKKSESAAKQVSQLIYADQEYLGFKYWYLKENGLFAAFASYFKAKPQGIT